MVLWLNVRRRSAKPEIAGSNPVSTSNALESKWLKGIAFITSGVMEGLYSMKDFFSFIYGDQEGLACVTRTDHEGNPTRDKFFEYPAQLDEMVKHCTRFSHESIYFCPTLMDENKRRKTSVKAAEVAFADADTCPVDTLRAQPSLIAQTSPTKTHVYWKFTDETNPLELERRSHAVSNAHLKSLTDLDDGWAANKLLRVPGTTNLKYDEAFKVTYEITGQVYTTEEFDELYPAAELLHVVQTALPESIPTRAEAMNQINFTAELNDILYGEYRKDTGRYKALHLALHELFRAGATNEVAFSIVESTDLHKWRTDGVSDADQRLWEDIQRARGKSELIDPSEAAPLAMQEDVEEYKSIDFLTKEERASLKPTIVDEFVKWSGSKTHTSPDFQIAAGINILSTVFSDFGHVPMKFGKLPLNLWFLVSGRSTTDRKTTVLYHMMDVLRGLSREEDYHYNFGSDFTVAALSDQLLDRPNRSGLVHVDEFQGFLAELGKNYMAGTKDALTAMYSGRIKGKLRSTAEKKMRPEVNFQLSFYAMGITTQIAEALSREDFLSGFLTRFIWVSPSKDFVSPDINDGFELESLDVQNRGDDEFLDIIQKIRAARDHFEMFSESLDAPTKAIRPTDAAMGRIHKLRTDMVGVAKDFGKDELISSADRLSQSVLKVAALFAMADCRDAVEVHDVLSATQYANSWFMNLLRMEDQVNSSTWVKDQEEIVAALIEQQSSMDARDLYKKFKDKHKPRDYNEMLKALENSGEIQMVQEKKRVLVNYVGGQK